MGTQIQLSLAIEIPTSFWNIFAAPSCWLQGYTALSYRLANLSKEFVTFDSNPYHWYMRPTTPHDKIQERTRVWKGITMANTQPTVDTTSCKNETEQQTQKQDHIIRQPTPVKPVSQPSLEGQQPQLPPQCKGAKDPQKLVPSLTCPAPQMSTGEWRHHNKWWTQQIPLSPPTWLRRQQMTGRLHLLPIPQDPITKDSLHHWELLQETVQGQVFTLNIQHLVYTWGTLGWTQVNCTFLMDQGRPLHKEQATTMVTCQWTQSLTS